MMPTAYIPTLDGRDRLRVVLESLRAQTAPCRVVVVDNGSTDGTETMLAEEFPECERFSTGTNDGFGVALNRAIAATGDGPILLLNDDLSLESDFVAEIMSVFEQGHEVVCGILTRPDDRDTIDSAGVVADGETLAAFDYLEGEPVTRAESAPPPLGPTGGAALYDRAAFEAVGGFDPNIFAYYEDLDLALRLRNEGVTCALAPKARAAHWRSSTLGSRSPRKYALTGWSRGYLLRRYGVLRSLRTAVRGLAFEAATVVGQMAIDHTTAGLKGRFKGWRDAKGLPRRTFDPTGMGHFSLRQSIRSRMRRFF